MNIPSLVEIAVAPEPNLTLTVSPDTIRSGTQATLSWVGHELSGVTFSDIGYQKPEVESGTYTYVARDVGMNEIGFLAVG
ncbi:hypothetical protein AB6D11_00835 [Vibrio splendidus]